MPSVVATPSERRMKSLQELASDLGMARERLKDLIDAVRGGKQAFANVIATELRSLVSWSDNPRNQRRGVPLLLLLAKHLDLPLPVFVYLDYADAQVVDSLMGPDFVFLGSEFSVQRRTDKQIVVDLQEWLDAPSCFVVRGKQNIMKNRQTIRALTETEGPGHYDLAVPRGTDHMSKHSLFQVKGIAAFMAMCGIGVLELCDYVLGRLQDQT